MVINDLSCPRDTASVAHTLIHSDGLVIDIATGDILGYDSKPSVFSLAITYATPKHNTSHSYESGWLLDPADALDLADDLVSTLVDEDESEPTSSGSGRGRKPNMFDNKVSRHVQVASEVNAHWLDDFIYGACYVCVGASNGKLNVSPGDVLRVCMLPTITTKGVRRIILNHHLDQLSTRQAQRLAKAAMYAVRGIGLFLERHPAELAVLEYEIQFAATYQDEVTAPTEATLCKEIQLTTDIREEHLTVVLRTERKYQMNTLLAA